MNRGRRFTHLPSGQPHTPRAGSEGAEGSAGEGGGQGPSARGVGVEVGGALDLDTHTPLQIPNHTTLGSTQYAK